MTSLLVRRRFLPVESGILLFQGPASEVDLPLAWECLDHLRVNPPILRIYGPGAVVRDLSKASSWIEWYCGYQHRKLSDPVNRSAFLTCTLVTDAMRRNLNIVLAVEPVRGGGRLSLRSYVTRISGGEFVCFEY